MSGESTSTVTRGPEVAHVPGLRVRAHRLRRGRTRILAVSDLGMLAVAYTASYLIADRIAPLPPVSGDAWFLALVAVTAPFVWLTVFTANKLYDNDSLRISVSSFDETRDLFHAMLVGSLGYLLLNQGVDYFFGWWVYTPAEAFIFLAVALVLIPVARGTIRSWVFPRLMQPRRTLIVGTRRRGAARLPQDHRAPGVRPRDRRLPQRRGRGGRRPAGAGDRLGRRSRRDRRLVRGRPDPYRIVGGKPRRDARPSPHRPPARRARLDRAALLRDLHVATRRWTTSRACPW